LRIVDDTGERPRARCLAGGSHSREKEHDSHDGPGPPSEGGFCAVVSQSSCHEAEYAEISEGTC
jgi:hypothetical protein